MTAAVVLVGVAIIVAIIVANDLCRVCDDIL
jgi:hypothetical protein